MAFELASRKKTFHLIGLTGMSGWGKSYSALRLARGIAKGGKIGFIDTENGRGSMYSQELGPYFIDELHSPFSSVRYAAKMEEAAKEGFAVLIIDSFSHEWEGTDGVLEYAEEIERTTRTKGLQKWNKPKVAHKKMMNVLTQLPMHVIACLRAKEKKVQVKNPETGKDEIINEGIVPIQDSRFLYEMTLSLILNEKYQCTYRKGPDALRPFFENKVMTEEIGENFRQWANEGEILTPERKLIVTARERAAFGNESLLAYWNSLNTDQKKILKPSMDEIKANATAADKELTETPEREPGDEPAEGPEVV